MSEQKKSYDYINQSRGYKTKGNSYKDRYVEAKCPECGHNKAYKDTWRTKAAFTCMKRDCKHKWYLPIDVTQKDESKVDTSSSVQDLQEENHQEEVKE